MLGLNLNEAGQSLDSSDIFDGEIISVWAPDRSTPGACCGSVQKRTNWICLLKGMVGTTASWTSGLLSEAYLGEIDVRNMVRPTLQQQRSVKHPPFMWEFICS
jgi:hypothetical protein